MSLFGSLGKALKSVTKNVGKSFGNMFSGSGSIFGGTDMFTGINPIEDYTGVTAAKMQQDIAEKNYQEQKRQFDVQNALNERQFQYQKELNQLQNDREDTAYQRKFADLKAAGLNPILGASGSGAASTLGSSPALRAAPAAQMDSSFTDKYGSAAQNLVNGVLSLITMKKDFAMKDAQIKLFQAEKGKVDAEAAGINTENEFKADYLKARNKNLELENELKSGTLQNNIDLSASKLSISRKEELVKNMELILAQDKHVLNKIDYDIQKLVKEGKIKENDILDKKLELLTTECLQKSLDYSNAQWDTDYYHGYGVPVGFNSSWVGQLGQFIGQVLRSERYGFGKSGSEVLSDYFESVTGSRPIYNDVRRPNVSGFINIYRRKMINSHDYGAKRNVF